MYILHLTLKTISAYSDEHPMDGSDTFVFRCISPNSSTACTDATELAKLTIAKLFAPTQLGYFMSPRLVLAWVSIRGYTIYCLQPEPPRPTQLPTLTGMEVLAERPWQPSVAAIFALWRR